MGDPIAAHMRVCSPRRGRRRVGSDAVSRVTYPQFRFAALWALFRRPFQGLKNPYRNAELLHRSSNCLILPVIAQRDLWGKDKASWQGSKQSGAVRANRDP